MPKHKLLALVESLFKDHPAFVFLSDAHLLSEEFQTTEHRAFVVVDIRDEFGVDNIDAANTSHQNHTVVGTGDGALVIGSLLQTVLTAETAHEERPLTIVLLLRHDVRDTMLRHHPHRVELILSDTHDTRSEESGVHVK